MRNLDDRLRSTHFRPPGWQILKYLCDQFPNCVDIASSEFAEVADDSAFIGAVEALRDDGLILYEQFVRDGINPPLFVMVSLSIKGERLTRNYSQII